MNITLSKTVDAGSGILIAVPSTAALKRHPGMKLLEASDRDFVQAAVEAEEQWDKKSALILPLPSFVKATEGKFSSLRRVLVMGVAEKKDQTSYTMELQGRRALTLLKRHRMKSASLWLTDFTAPRVKPQDALARTVIALHMADYAYNRYKQVPQGGWPEIATMTFVVDTVSAPLKRALIEGEIIAESVNACRDLSNTPGGDMTPATLAGAALALGEEEKKIAVTVFDTKKLKKLGMGGVLGVSRGSDEEPKFIILEYKGGPKSRKPIVFIGKGVTFDTGGLNLKPGQSMNEMHMDMSGGGAVLGAMAAIAKLKLKINVIGLIPAVENMPSGSSYHPGDVLKTYSGKTIEIGNTDAEGRVIMADALGYAKQYEPDLVVDVATLTGAAMVALGKRVIGLFVNDVKLEKLGRDVGDASGDRVWPLPAWDEYLPDIVGTVGDVNNIGKTRDGGAITAAVFLKQFVDYPWIHLDIAPRMVSIEGDHLAKGAVGAGVRFLVELARRKAGR